MLTYQDAVERLIDYLGAQASDTVLRDAKQSVIEALRDLVQAHPWTYLYTFGTINTDAMFTDGTITYLVSSGVRPFEVTLTGGVWPAWANMGMLAISNLYFDVTQRISDQVILLSPAKAPLADITTPTPFGLFHGTYALPDDFAAQDTTFIPNNFTFAGGGLSFIHPREWLQLVEGWNRSGTPICYSITANPYRPNGFALRLAPLPDSQYPIDFTYKRHAHAGGRLAVFREASGTVSTDPSNMGGIVTAGSGTAFSTAMAGTSVLRISRTLKQAPTAEFGDNPGFESKIVSVDPTAQTVVTFDPVPFAITGASYVISSFIDIEPATMGQAFLRCAEMHIGMSRVMKDKPSARKQYQEALEVAKAADSRSMLPRSEGTQYSNYRRLRDYPLDLSRFG